MSNINRLAILCFYEEDGYVDSYVYHLVNELLSIANKMFIVANGKIEEKAKVYFEQHSCEVVVRENKGYDATAYKYVIEMIGRDAIKDFSQIILCNDTFFGPFIPMKSIFAQMNMEECDFWGISYKDTKLVQFIGSYLLVFGEKIIQSDDLWNYFKDMNEIVTYQDARIHFELGVFLYLKRRGYTSASLIKKKKYFSNVIYPYENLIYEQLPILKKRAFKIRDSWKIIEAIKYIRDNYNYDINLIEDWMKRKKIELEEIDFPYENNMSVKMNDLPIVSINDIYNFISKWKKICIYGNGYYGHILIDLYQIKPQYIIVSDGWISQQNYYIGIPIREISQIDIKDRGMGIIVALSKANTESVKIDLGDGCNILYLW